MNRNIIKGLVAASVLTATAASQAAVDAGVSTAITGAGTDGAAIVGLLAVAGAGVFLIKKVLTRLGISF